MGGVPDLPSSDIALADGVTTVFSFTFFVYQEDDIQVFSVLDDVELEITSGITKSINSSFIGGSITFDVAPLAAIGTILIKRAVKYEQTTEFSDLTRYKETAIETALNVLTLQIQQLRSDSDLSLKYSEASGVNDAVISTPVDGQVLTFSGVLGRITGALLGSLSSTIDTAFSGLAVDDLFQYNGTNWVNKTINEIKTSLGLNLNNFSGTAAPTVNDDSGDGYSVGSQWFDTVGDDMYYCLDSSVGAAVWQQGDVVASDLGSAALATLIDDDSFATATSLNVPSSESVKAYVDAASGILSSEATSSEITVASGQQTYSFTHGLGSSPKFHKATLVCKIADLNYPVGHVIDLTGMSSVGSNVLASSHSSTVIQLKQQNAITIPNNTTTSNSAINYSNWKLVLYGAA